MARAGSPSMAGEAHAASPPPVMSKRDKRRSMLADRLEQMFESFGQNLRQQYDAQSSAIQVDVHLIMRENPYTNQPLDDDMETIERKIQDITSGKVPGEGAAADSYRRDVGQEYVKFVQDINNAMEDKDISLNLLAEKYHSTRRELIQRHSFHVKVAEGEHAYLAQTIRQRLANQVTKKKEKLLKEKDQLDIGESSAYHLHPNHYSLNNPSSPGGAHKRATRNTGRRGGDTEEAIPYTNGRKRKAYVEDLDGQSPAPITKYDPGANGIFSNARARANYTQFEAPVYSFSELFTEVELNMALNNSAIAAQQYLQNQSGQEGQIDVVTVNGVTGALDNGSITNEADGVEIPAGGADMERTASQSYHQTRGVTRQTANEQAAAVARENPLGPAMPTIAPLHRGQRAGGLTVYIQPLNNADIDNDLSIFTGEKQSDYDWDQALEPARQVEYQWDPRGKVDQEAAPVGSSNPTYGGVPMSAQSSMAGVSTGGGEPMSRQTSAMGGISMKRTASNRSAIDVRRQRSRFQ